jgi:hypothetical protein
MRFRSPALKALVVNRLKFPEIPYPGVCITFAATPSPPVCNDSSRPALFPMYIKSNFTPWVMTHFEI